MRSKYCYTLVLFLFSLALLKAQTLPDTLADESEISVNTAEGKIAGKLVCPPQAKTLVLIIAGSGPTDMNGNNNAGLKTDSYKMIADFLRKEGIASVRYDKRGIGKSSELMKKESDLRFDDYVNDVVLWINLLKADKRFSKIIVLGHSEGSLLGMIACSKTNADGFISVAGAGLSADKILKEQLSTQPKFISAACDSIIDSLVAGKEVKKINPLLYSLFRPSIQPYMISWFRYNPATEIARLKIPVCIIQGSTDAQIKVKDAEVLRSAKPDAAYFLIQDMNHVLKTCTGDAVACSNTYYDAQLPLKKEFADKLKQFLATK